MKLDAYQRSAQLYPAILTVISPLVVTLFWLPGETKIITSSLSVTASAALAVLLMHIARIRGRAVQARLTALHGALESTIGLRHRDTHIAQPSRLRYHAYLAGKGLRMPTAAEELADPAEADQCYRSAADWLREHTRSQKKFTLLQGENRTYGFRRNLRGLKAIGVGLAALAFLGNAAALWLDDETKPHLLGGCLLGALLGLGILVWIFVVTDAFVDDASWAYTTRLLAACDTLSDGDRAVSRKKSSKNAA